MGAGRGAGEILLTSMDRDGTNTGYDLALTSAVSEAVNRNADNLPPGEKMPGKLDWLRTPGGLTRGPK